MTLIAEAFFGGCMSKVINDGKDYTWAKIKKIINDKNNQNISTKICRVIEKSLNTVTDKKFKDTDKLYDTIEKIFNEFRDNGSTIESVKCGLKLLGSDASNQRCKILLEKFYEEICQDNDLYKVISLILQEKGIEFNQKEFQQLNQKIDNLTDIVSDKNNNKIEIMSRTPVKSRTQEYADKWNENMFLNDFSEWDENAGVNVKLKDVLYKDEHLPRFIWGDNKNTHDNLNVFLSKYVGKNYENGMLLILGQPGIGKSTLVTWLTVKFSEKSEDILVYKFADDLKNIDWTQSNVSMEILNALNLSYNDLNGKVLIFDGFDEVSIEANSRRDILDNLYGEWIYGKKVENVTLIITCRENYIQGFERLKCNYIVLQAWSGKQIRSFCNTFQTKTDNIISEDMINKLLENREIMGIPLILYMVLALNISIEKEGSIVDVYDKIFSLEGGIYDRCIDNKNFANKHRIAKIKKQIHQISREIAIWMFENNSEEASIPQKEYMNICDCVMRERVIANEEMKQDFKVGSYFKLIKHCEGVETEELTFVHRSIYEYFVVEAIYSSVENAMSKLAKESQEEFAKKIANYLKKGIITNTIGEYLQYKLLKMYNVLEDKKREYFFQWWEEAIEKMIDKGMFYYTSENIQKYKNIIDEEIQCFANLVKILHPLYKKTSEKKYIWENIYNKEQLENYIRFSLAVSRVRERYSVEKFNLSHFFLVGTNFSGADFKFTNLQGANLSEANLSEINLSEVNLQGVNLQGANLKTANLQEADLCKANLCKADLREANLFRANLREVNLSRAILCVTDLRKVNLERADLREANLTGANLEGADLREADLRGADFTKAHMEEIYLNGAIIDEWQVLYFEKKNKLYNMKICITKTQKIVDYDEYYKEV